jgi:hypothetical protein
MEWLWRSGCCISEPRGRRALKTYRALDAHRAELPGVGGEAGRSTYWWAGDTAKGRIDLEVMIRRKAVSTPPEVLRRGRMWLDALPADNMLHIIDVMYIEQRLGCWGGVLPYADRSLCLPSDYLFRGHFPRDIVEREWPELLEVPFNEPVGWRRLLTKAGKNLKRAQKLLLHPVQTAAQIRERSRRF